MRKNKHVKPRQKRYCIGCNKVISRLTKAEFRRHKAPCALALILKAHAMAGVQ